MKSKCFSTSIINPSFHTKYSVKSNYTPCIANTVYLPIKLAKVSTDELAFSIVY